jgi:hypothetical protein
VASSAVPAPVTHAELAGLVRAEIARSHRPTREGRRRLLALVEELTPDAVTDPAGLLENRQWRIASITVAGVGGIGAFTPPTLDLAPTCALTVVRGPNGCGKTSLATAFEVTLTGSSSGGPPGELWSAALLTEGASRAAATVVLVSGSARLEIRAEFDAAPDGRVSAVLTDAEGSRAVELESGWREALRSSRACFGYAGLQARLHDSKDLQSFGRRPRPAPAHRALRADAPRGLEPGRPRRTGSRPRPPAERPRRAQGVRRADGPPLARGPVERRVRVLMTRRRLEQQARTLLCHTEKRAPADRRHQFVVRRLMLLTAGVPPEQRAAAYGLARRAGAVYGETSKVLHSNRAFADVPEALVREWEDVVEEVENAVAARASGSRDQ